MSTKSLGVFFVRLSALLFEKRLEERVRERDAAKKHVFESKRLVTPKRARWK
jgi:hypothetical protein